MKSFASDNNSGICPEALLALQNANDGHAPAYGNDVWTEQTADRIRELFECDCDVYFVFNGTAANSLALASLCQSYHSVICHQFAHVSTDECGAPEFFSNGSKLLPCPGEQGKLWLNEVRRLVLSRTDIHFPKPRVLTLTQATEAGTVYTPDEVLQLSNFAKERGLRVHMDGARFANALVSLGVSPAEATWKVGVDVLCFGGTKMGLPVGEAVVFFDRTLSEDFAWRCKQAGQLASKMRFLAAPWMGVLEGHVWRKHASHANAMAERLSKGMLTVPGVSLSYPTQANGVFLHMPSEMQTRLRAQGWQFYSFLAAGDVRLMCAWDTTPESVDAFVAAALG